MDPHRSGRMGEAIRKVISDVILREVKDPRVSMVAVDTVELNRDGTVARVFVNVIGSDEERALALAGLAQASGFLQRRVGRTLRLRQTPELRFSYNDVLDRSTRLDEMLSGLAARGEFESEEERLRRLELRDLQPPAELIDALTAGERVWIVPHFNPDPDAMGAALALAEALEAIGVETTVFGFPDPPVNLGELPGSESVVQASAAEELLAAEPPDLAVVVDAHRKDRCGPLEAILDRIDDVWCVDHHLVSGRRAPLPGWVDARASSACTLIHQVIEALAVSGRDEEAEGAEDREPAFELTLSMATNIYAGLLNDTGGFRFSNTLPLSFELARRLARCGVDVAGVARLTLHRYRREGVRLLQLFLGTFTYHADGTILMAHVDRAMLAETGASMADTETYVNIATAVQGVEYVAFLKELEDGAWRLSLRARGEGDVEAVAARHGGGGHRLAAGCTLEGELDDLKALIVAELSAQPGA
ncbi:MAG: 30S ribosome-binding factor RbfA [Candidatus Krumholzibacteriia bacterium]